MTCYQHPGMPAAARCAQCGKEICAVCAVRVGDKTACRDCADVLRSQQPAPAAEEPQPEAQVPAEAPAQAAAPAPAEAEKPVAAPAPSAGEPSGMPVPAKPSAITPVPRPTPPATTKNDPGAGGRRKKESLLAAALSLILPGAGQVYNEQMAKGLVLAAIYLGTLAIVGGGMIVTALTAGRYGGSRSLCCCCLPLFIVPIIVLVYAIYDAYNTAENINNNRPVREWP